MSINPWLAGCGRRLNILNIVSKKPDAKCFLNLIYSFSVIQEVIESVS